MSKINAVLTMTLFFFNLGSESDWDCLQSCKDCEYKSPDNTSAIVVVSPNAKTSRLTT
jgi:hypothetical protein